MTTIKKRLKMLAQKYILVFMMIGLAIIMSIVNSNFASWANAVNILRNISVQGIMACGVTLVLISGEIDLSFGATAGLSGMIVALFCDKMSSTGIMSVEAAGYIGLLISLLVAVIIGLLNAYWIVVWKMPSVISTLAMQFAIYGIAGTLSGGFPNYTLPKWFSFFGTNKVFTIPICIFIFLGIFAILYIILNKSKLGRGIYAVGGNSEAARLSGINVAKTKSIALVLMQVCAAVAGWVISSQIMSASAKLGQGSELTIMAAVIIGGTGVGGGKGNIVGTLLGLLFLGIIMNSLTLANVSEFPQYIVRGALIIFAIVLNTLQSRNKRTARKRVKAKKV